jgi:hypothetical protein
MSAIAERVGRPTWRQSGRPGLRREIGFIGLLWASGGSIIGSGWPQFELRSAMWLPVYLIGMGLIVYLSDFGPTAHPWFPLWWDMVAVAVFSLAIYLWALRLALPLEKIEWLIDRGQTVPS